MQFLCNIRRSEKYQHLLHGNQVYIAYEEVCYWFNGDEFCEVQELSSNQGEVDVIKY